MSKVTDVNNLPATGAEAMYMLKELLKSAGWTVTKSSDGTTYNASGDEITSGGSGANGMANAHAWFVIQSPAGSGYHEWCFQRETASDNREWRVKMSAGDGFSGGTPGATQVPSATDEQVMHGSGTDASPTMADLFPIDGTYRWHIVAEDAAVGTAVEIYPFFAFTTIGVQGQTFIFQDALDMDTAPELSSGTRAAPVKGDPDPCVYYCKYSTADACFLPIAYWLAGNTYVPECWYKYNYVDEAFVEIEACDMRGDSQTYRGTPWSTNGFSNNPYNSEDMGFPIYLFRDVALSQSGAKGFLHSMRYKTLNKVYPSTVNLSSDSYVYVGQLLIPWEDGTAPLT